MPPGAKLRRTASSGQLSLRVVSSTDQIAEVGRLTRPLVRFLRRRWRLLRAGGRFRNSENEGEYSQMAPPLKHIATTDLRAAWMKKYNRANIAGQGPETAPGSSVSSSRASFRPGDKVSREVDRCRTANVAPGPAYLPLLVFSQPT